MPDLFDEDLDREGLDWRTPYVGLRRTLRLILAHYGVLSNPFWTDRDIVNAIIGLIEKQEKE